MSSRLPRREFHIYMPEDFDAGELAILEQGYGGELEGLRFVVWLRKWRDDEANGATWDGWPFTRGGMPAPVRVDHPTNEKSTFFLFFD